jgi:hypothetical protein
MLVGLEVGDENWRARKLEQEIFPKAGQDCCKGEKSFGVENLSFETWNDTLVGCCSQLFAGLCRISVQNRLFLRQPRQPLQVPFWIILYPKLQSLRRKKKKKKILPVASISHHTRSCPWNRPTNPSPLPAHPLITLS